MIDSNISHDEFVSINNVLKEFFDVKEETKNPIDNWKFKLYKKTMLPYCLKCNIYIYIYIYILKTKKQNDCYVWSIEFH